MIQKNTKNEVDEIESLLSTLISKIKRDESNTYVSQEQVGKLHHQFKELDTSIYNHKELHIDSSDRMDELTARICNLSELDFSETVDEGDQENHLEHLAMCINLCQENLKQNVNDLTLIKALFNSFKELHIITQTDGSILFANNALTDTYGIKNEDLSGKSIQTFFNTPTLREKYNINFDGKILVHGIDETYYNNEHSKIVLNVSVLPFQHDKKEYFLYKIIPTCKQNNSSSSAIQEQMRQLLKEFNMNLTKIIDTSQIEEKDNIINYFHDTLRDKKSRMSFNELIVYESLKQLK